MSPSLSLGDLLLSARKLVPFLPPRPISPRGANDQEESFFYGRLPPELRQMIWDTCVRGHIVHVYPSYKRLRGKECVKAYIGDGDRWGPHFHECTREELCNHLSLLLTCKKIYFEYIDMFYQDTTFDFSHAHRSLLAMPKRLPPSNFARITRLNLSYFVFRPLHIRAKKHYRGEIFWVRCWDTLATMKGLKWLRFELKLAWTKVEPGLLDGVKKVTHPPHFELVFPFYAAASTREETLPCTVIREGADPIVYRYYE